jgi:hypothetical protein
VIQLVVSNDTREGVTTKQVVRLGVMLTLATAVLMSVRFARFDWTRLSLEYLPESVTLEVSSGCTEEIGRYVASNGRVIEPVAIDDHQYLAMVQHYRGVAADELQVECFYRPYTGRFAQPWIAHLLPFDEGLSLAIVNGSFLIGAVWAMLFALKGQGVSPRSMVVVGTFYALGWNTLFSGAIIMTDPGVLGVMSLGWLLIVHRRWFWCVLLALAAIPVRESVVLLLPVVLAGLWDQHKAEPQGSKRVSGRGHYGLLLTAVGVVLAVILANVLWSKVALEPAATFASQVSLQRMLWNIFTPSIFTTVVASGPLYVPAMLKWWAETRRVGLLNATLRPAPAGLLCTIGLLLWVLAGADFSSRFTWVGFPFAAAMAAEWFDAGGIRSVLDRLAPERLLGIRDRGGRVASPESSS